MKTEKKTLEARRNEFKSRLDMESTLIFAHLWRNGNKVNPIDAFLDGEEKLRELKNNILLTAVSLLFSVILVGVAVLSKADYWIFVSLILAALTCVCFSVDVFLGIFKHKKKAEYLFTFWDYYASGLLKIEKYTGQPLPTSMVGIHSWAEKQLINIAFDQIASRSKGNANSASAVLAAAHDEFFEFRLVGTDVNKYADEAQIRFQAEQETAVA